MRHFTCHTLVCVLCSALLLVAGSLTERVSSPCRLQLLIRSVKYSGPSAMTEKYKGALVALVEPRFNAQANYLNLSKLQGIEVEGFKIDFNNVSTMRTLWSVIAQKCPTVRRLLYFIFYILYSIFYLFCHFCGTASHSSLLFVCSDRSQQSTWQATAFTTSMRLRTSPTTSPAW